MIEFSQYPHVNSLIRYYATLLSCDEITKLMDSEIKTELEAISFSKFIWKMLDQMAIDIKHNKMVLGNIDNSTMIPDIDYEVSLYLSEHGFDEVWDKICDEN